MTPLKEIRDTLWKLGAFVGFETLSKDASCRGMSDYCEANKGKRVIPKGETVLRISVHGNGGHTAYYCKTCSEPILKHIKDL